MKFHGTLLWYISGPFDRGRLFSAATLYPVPGHRRIFLPGSPSITGRTINQHRVAVGIEAITLLDGVPIGFAYGLDSGERRDEHEQGRSRQVEVGDQLVDHAEPESGDDEQVGLGFAGDRGAVDCGRGFEAAHGGRADGDEFAAAFPRRFDRYDIPPATVAAIEAGGIS